MFAHNSTKRSRRSNKIRKKVVRATVNVPHEFQGQQIKGQGHQAALGAVRSPLAAARHIVAAALQATQLVIQEAQLMLTNPRDAFRCHSRSRNMVPFDMLGMVSY